MEKIYRDFSEVDSIIVNINNTGDTKKNMKKMIHFSLEQVGLTSDNTDKRITMATSKLGKQYDIMSSERFIHRFEKNKVQRDIKYLLSMVRFMAQFGKEAAVSTLESLFSDGHYLGLDVSPSLKALGIVLRKAKKIFLERGNSIQIQEKIYTYKQFQKMVGKLLDEVYEK